MKTVTISENCIQCGLCVKVCPSNVFTQSHKGEIPIVKHPQSCIACGHCEAVCESDAVISETFRSEGKTIPIKDDTLSLLASLRSIRNYQKTPISQKELSEIIQSGYNAPTAQNIRQIGIEFYEGELINSITDVVALHMEKLGKIGHPLVLGVIRLFHKNKAKFLSASLKKLTRVAASIRKEKYHLFHQAPHIIVIHAPESNHYSKDDCDAALNYIRIAAHAKGFGSCIIGFAMVASAPIKKHLKLPKENKIYGIISIGKPSVKYAKGIVRKTEVES